MAGKHVGKSSQIFSPFRAIGFVSNHVPLDLQVKRGEHYVTTAVGYSFHLYGCSKLNLLFVGQPLSDPIELILSLKQFRIVGAGKVLSVYARGKKIRQYADHNFPVLLAVILGEHVVSVDQGNVVHVWDHLSLEAYSTFSLDANTFRISAAVHPSTYLNKVLFGSHQGSLQLWNMRTNTMIYHFDGWKSPVTVLEQAPAVDVIGVGLLNGAIIIHNIKFDESLMKFHQEFGPVTGITFRTDGAPVMLSGSTAGHISIFDLEKKKFHSLMRAAHTGSVTGMKFLQKQPILISSGPDNSLKMWIFDNPDGSGRLLRSRSGHSGPPTNIHFYGFTGHAILSSGLDRALRFHVTTRDNKSREITQGSLISHSKASGVSVEELRLPPIIDISSARDNDWDNIVTCHYNCPFPHTWKLSRSSIGKHRLGKSNNFDGRKAALTTDISSCGNFVAVGYASGHAGVFNMQSGLYRGDLSAGKEVAHDDAVRGIAFGSANVMVITGSADKSIKFWNFQTKSCTASLRLHCPLSKMKMHRESSLLIAAYDDFSLHVIDVDTRRIVREFPGHSNVITSIGFSNDARWLLSSSVDGSIKVWDIPAARLIDCFLVDTPATCVALSPTGDFLATTHVDDLGIYLWSNDVLYSGIYPSPLPNDYEPPLVDLPTTQIETADAEFDEAGKSGQVEGIRGESQDYKTPEQIGHDLITLSLLPESRWRSLVNLDLIKQRNKPKEPPKKPKAAPFFLPTVAGVETKFDLTKSADESSKSSNSNVLSSTLFAMNTNFHAALNKACEEGNYGLAGDVLKTLSPSQTDIEIRTLAPDAGGSIHLMKCMLVFLQHLLLSGKDYELAQAYVALFIKSHGDLLMSTPELWSLSVQLQSAVKSTWAKCEDLINQSLCLVNYFKSATI